MQAPIKKLVTSPLAAACAAALVVATAHAQSYPDQAGQIPGAVRGRRTADTMARLTAQTLSQGLNQTIVIDNRPGAGGIIGARAAALADPDGYTLMYGNTASLVVGPAVYANPGYDPVKAFAPDRTGRGQLQCAGGQSEISRQFGAGADRLRQAEPGQGQFRVARPRHTAAHGRRDVQAARRRSTSCTFPTRARPPRSPTSWAEQVEMTFENPSVVDPAGAGRQAQGARRHRRDPQSEDSGRADHGRGRAAPNSCRCRSPAWLRPPARRPPSSSRSATCCRPASPPPRSAR